MLGANITHASEHIISRHERDTPETRN